MIQIIKSVARFSHSFAFDDRLRGTNSTHVPEAELGTYIAINLSSLDKLPPIITHRITENSFPSRSVCFIRFRNKTNKTIVCRHIYTLEYYYYTIHPHRS